MHLFSARFFTLTFIVFLLNACGSHYALIKKDNFDLANQCVAQHSRALEQHDTVQQLLIKLGDTLSRPLIVQDSAAYVVSQDHSCDQQSDVARAIANRHTQMQVVGEIELINLPELGLSTEARIDTGATTSSIDARNTQVFERDGEQWVRFELPNNTSGETIQVERPLLRKVKVSQASVNQPQSRLVIQLQLVIGKHTQMTEFTLSDRSHLSYQVLIGRNVLRDVMLVDVSQSLLAPLPSTINNSQP